MTATEPSAPPTGEQPSRHSPLTKTARDLVLSMGLIGLIIAVAMVVSMAGRTQPDPVHQVDALPVAQAAATVAGFPILYPTDIEGWRATSARWEPTEESDDDPVWFNGWVTPNDEYAAVIQSANTTKSFIKESTGGAAKVDASEIAATGWQPYEASDGGQRWLVRTEDQATTVVTSTMDWAGLVSFRDSLRPVR